MENQKTLPQGREFERYVFGVTDEAPFIPGDRRPGKRSFKASFQRIIAENWADYAEAIEKGLQNPYNPSNPKVAMTGVIWSAVKRYLPRRVGGETSGPLNLYIAIGKTSFDWDYGVDAFFWWEGALVTIDASVYVKPDSKLKADFLLNPWDLDGDKLENFGRKVANLLKERRFKNRKKKKILIKEDESLD